MGITAETLAEKHDISQQQCDAFAVLSNHRWKVGLFICYHQPQHMTDMLFAASYVRK